MSIRTLIQNLAPQEPLNLKPRAMIRATPNSDPISPKEMLLLDAERSFADRAHQQGAHVWRGGWPDFLVQLSGQHVGVEIKRGEDRISASQARMFAALEASGLRVFVWNPRMPTALIPWAVYMPLSSTRSVDGLKKLELQYQRKELT